MFGKRSENLGEVDSQLHQPLYATATYFIDSEQDERQS